MSLCFGGPRVPLSGNGPKLMWTLRCLNLALLAISIVAIMGTRYVDGALFIVFSLLFFLPLKDTKTAGTDIMCILFMTAFQGVFSLIYFILQLAGVRVYNMPGIAWKKNCLLASVYAFPWIFILCAILAYLVFRNVRQSMTGSAGARPAPGQQTSHGSGGFGYDADRDDDVESKPKGKQQAQKPSNDWKKGGGRKLG